MDFDEILVKCGNDRRYQYLLLGLYSFLMFVTAMHNFSQNVISFVPKHWCYHEQLENLSYTQIEAIYRKFERPSCTKLTTIDLDSGNATMSEEKCDRFIYEYDHGFRSMNTELNWVCDAEYKSPVGQSFFFVGSMFGTIIFGFLGDRIGRIKAVILANWCGFLGDFSTIFADNLITFSITRFVSGLAVDANSYLMFILVLEYVSPTLRNTGLNLSMGVFYCLGMICSSWLAVYVGHWKVFLACSSLPLLLVTLFYFLVQESAQWLVTRNDFDGAVERLQRVAKINKQNLSDSDIDAFRSYCQKAQDSKEEENKIVDIFKFPRLRNTSLRALTVFMIVTLCYNTVSRHLDVDVLSPFIMFSLSALTLPPAGLVLASLQKVIGRKGCSVSAMLLTGLFTSASGIVISLWSQSGSVIVVILMLASRFGISVCSGSIMMFTTELVPTTVRSRGLAFSHLAGAALSLLSPYILHMGTFYRAAPFIIQCLLFFIGAYVCLLLPETRDRKLPITLAEGDEFGKGERMFDFLRSSSQPKTVVEAELEAETNQKLMS